MALFLGIDLGGTNIKVGLVDEAAQLIAKVSVVTPAEEGPDAVLKTMAQTGLKLVSDNGASMDQIAGIGVGSPGPLDLKRGIVRQAPNLPGWTNVPVEETMRKLTGRPCILENDANAAAFGEYWAGAGKNASISDFVAFTLGTGIGSGIVVNGRIVHGASGMAGEGGHVIIIPNGRLCGCGQHGCVEAYASASSTARRAIEAIQAGAKSSLGQKYKGRLDQITSKDIFEAAKENDPAATAVVEETAEILALTCINFSRILEPQMIVFSGGMILAGNFLFEKIRHYYQKHTWKVPGDPPTIVPAVLGNDAGCIGAAAVAWSAWKDGRIK